MTHEEVAGELSALLDGALEPARRKAVEGHLSACDPCRRRLEELRAAVALFKRHARRAAPAALKAHALAAAREVAVPAPGLLRLWKPALAWSFVAAAALFVSTSALRRAMPGLFSQNAPQGMTAPLGTFAEGDEKAAAQLLFGSPEAAGSADRGAAPAAKAAVRGDEFADAAGARPFGAPSQAVEIGALGGAGARAGAGMGVSRRRAAAPRGRADEPQAPAPGPAALLRLFRDQAPFQAYWRSQTHLPVPEVDFAGAMVIVLAEPPPGRRWAIVRDEQRDEETRILYREVALPQVPPGMPAPSLPPAFHILPKSDKFIILHKVR